MRHGSINDLTYAIYEFLVADAMAMSKRKIGLNGNRIRRKAFLWDILHMKVSMLSMMSIKG